jgi:opacity protein-like surface antigen
MIERAFSRFFAPLLCASLIPAAALAQTQSKGFYVTIYGQHSQIGSSNTNESGALGGGSGLRAEFGSGTGFGGDIGYRYGNGWAAELEWNYRRHSLDRLLQGSSNLARDGDFASNILLINGLRRFAARGAWTPYAGAGIGWVQEIDIDISPSSGSAERGYSSSTLTPQWRLTADARWLRAGSVRLNNEVGNPGGSAGPLKYNPLSVQVGIRRSF